MFSIRQRPSRTALNSATRLTWMSRWRRYAKAGISAKLQGSSMAPHYRQSCSQRYASVSGGTDLTIKTRAASIRAGLKQHVNATSHKFNRRSPTMAWSICCTGCRFLNTNRIFCSRAHCYSCSGTTYRIVLRVTPIYWALERTISAQWKTCSAIYAGLSPTTTLNSILSRSNT